MAISNFIVGDDILKIFLRVVITVYLVHCFQRLWIEEEDRYT